MKNQGLPSGLVVKALPSKVGGVGSIPGGAKIPHTWRPKKQNIRQKQYCNQFRRDFKNVPHQNKIFFFFLKWKISVSGLRSSSRAISFLSGENLFPCRFWLGKAAYITWLLAPSSNSQASSVTSSNPPFLISAPPVTSLTLACLPLPYKDPCDDIEPIQTTQGNLLTSKSLI